MKYDIKEHVKGEATFAYYRAGELWYRSAAGLLFPVPVSDIGDATFNSTEKGMLMMRYMRKQIAALEAAG